MTYLVKNKAPQPNIDLSLPHLPLTINEAKARWEKHLEETRLSHIAFEYGIKSNRAT